MQKLAYLCLFMFIYVYLCLFMLSLRIFFSVVLQSLYTLAEIVSLNLHSHRMVFGLPPSGCQLKVLQILPIKLFDKILEPYLVRWSLLYLDVAA